MKKKISQKLRISILDRDGRKCLWCGRSAIDGVTLDVDHILAEHWGGKTTYENLGTLCSHCNRSKGADYYGSYLLTTLFKVKDFEKWFEDKFVGHNLGKDGDSYKWQIMFYHNQNGAFLPQTIEHEYFIGGILLVTKGNPDTDIKIAEKRKKALLELKDKIRDYLFKNKGFLEELNGKLIFRSRE
jgi:hypothetical protein